MSRSCFRCNAFFQSGVAAVEFALVCSLFFLTLWIGVIEAGRLLWTWNAAVEATRVGARLAVVCDFNAPVINWKMKGRLPALTDANIKVDYLDGTGAVSTTCSVNSCTAVRVKIIDYTHKTVIPFLPISLTLPEFATTLRKEFMASSGNSVCVVPTP